MVGKKKLTLSRKVWRSFVTQLWITNTHLLVPGAFISSVFTSLEHSSASSRSPTLHYVSMWTWFHQHPPPPGSVFLLCGIYLKCKLAFACVIRHKFHEGRGCLLFPSYCIASASHSSWHIVGTRICCRNDLSLVAAVL